MMSEKDACLITIVVPDEITDDAPLMFLEQFAPLMVSDRLHAGLGMPVCFSVSSDYKGQLESVPSLYRRDEKLDDIANWQQLAEKNSTDHVIRVWADAPFLDATVIQSMLKVHLDYLADFTFSENLPEGLGCEIFSAELLRSIPETGSARETLSKSIRRNINQFDVELYYQEPDLRDRRLSFRSADARERAVMTNLFRIENNVPAYSQLRSLIDSNPDVLYVGPAWLELELTTACDTETVYSYRKALDRAQGEMDADTLDRVLHGASSYGLPYAVCLGGAGDPLHHSSFYAMLQRVMAETLVNMIVIETDGLRLDANFAAFVQQHNDSRLRVIVEMNGHDSSTYAAIHGQDLFEQVLQNVLRVQPLLNTGEGEDRLYVQIMKINETEPFLDAYYDYWEPKKIPIILQKQNTFLGLVDDRRYSDLSPLERKPCWHLLRDLTIVHDGTVCFCKQDLNGRHASANVRDKELTDIVAARKALWLANYKADYPQQPDCASCDEWYTFNM